MLITIPKSMIGVFDSGLGGLTVLKQIKQKLPEYDYMYFGDTLHVPYGPRSQKAVFELTKKACDYLFDNGCKLIIIACNTASALALRELQSEYLPVINQSPPEADQPLAETNQPARNATHSVAGGLINILGVIRPVAEAFARSGFKKIGVIGTAGTVNSNIYIDECKDKRGKIKVIQKATPMLVPFIEEGLIKRKELKSILRFYLRDLKQEQVEALILGCTHYPLIIKTIRGIMGKNCFVPNPAKIVADSLHDYLQRHPEIESNLSKNAQAQYLVTDKTQNFQELAARFLGERIEVEKISY